MMGVENAAAVVEEQPSAQGEVEVVRRAQIAEEVTLHTSRTLQALRPVSWACRRSGMGHTHRRLDQSHPRMYSLAEESVEGELWAYLKIGAEVGAVELEAAVELHGEPRLTGLEVFLGVYFEEIVRRGHQLSCLRPCWNCVGEISENPCAWR